MTHTTAVFHYEGQAWCRQSPGSGGHHRISTVELQVLLVEFIPMMSAMITWLPLLLNSRKLDSKLEEDNSYNRTDNLSVEHYNKHIILFDWGLTVPFCPCTTILLVMASKVITLTFLFIFGSHEAFSKYLLLGFLAYVFCIVAIHCGVSSNTRRQ